MKRIIIYLIIILLCVSLLFIPKNKDNKQKIRLAEVTHSLFYTPLYVAIENNYFNEVGLDIELILTPGADKVASSVLSNDVEIGFAGPESTIYVYNGGEKDYLQTFAGLTKKDGQFIVSRTKDFNINDLKGKEIIVGRPGGMPATNFLNAMNNINIKENDMIINYSVEYANLSSAFISGVGDYVNLFEPNATKIEEQGLGYIVGAVGDYGDIVPYTTFFARKSYIENNKDIINKFRKAINKGLTYVKEHDSDTISKLILKQFPDTSLNEINKIVTNYKEHDSWFDSTTIKEEYFNNLENMLIKYKLIDNKVNFNDLIIND